MPRDAAREAARIEVKRRREPVRVTSLPIAAAREEYRRAATARAIREMSEDRDLTEEET